MNIEALPEYIRRHTVRGECKCGRCVDVGDRSDPTGHVISVGFFVVSTRNNPTVERLKELVKNHEGYFDVKMDPFDGLAHDYTEIGSWMGDQGIGLQFMALCALLGLSFVIPLKFGPLLMPRDPEDKFHLLDLQKVALDVARDIQKEAEDVSSKPPAETDGST